ncbi:hypothetical protein, partial [Mycobacterium helveticum]|uniref:hypothetical protein n=1 Tax=Mycobacterium helveticum TaxID=2592811 RepID=UPI001FE83004
MRRRSDVRSDGVEQRGGGPGGGGRPPPAPPPPPAAPARTLILSTGAVQWIEQLIAERVAAAR